MKKVTKVLGGAALSLVIVAGGVAGWHFSHPLAQAPNETAVRGGDAPPPVSESIGSLYGAPGTETAYTLDWATESYIVLATSQGAKPIDTTQSVNADVLVRTLGRVPGMTALAIRFGEIRKQEVSFDGKRIDVGSEKSAEAEMGLSNQDVFVTLDDRGVVSRVAFQKETPSPARQALSLLVKQMQVTLASSDTPKWEAEETDATGTAKVRYVATGRGEFARQRLAYTQLAALPQLDPKRQRLVSAGVVLLDDARALVSIEDSESVNVLDPMSNKDESVFRSATNFKLVRSSKPHPFNVASLAMNDLEDYKEADQEHANRDPHERDERAAKGVTPEGISAAIAGFSAGTKAPKGFVVHAGAYLRLHPEQCASLVALFGAKGTTPAGRGLILDVLSTAGDAAAQRAIRTVLSSAEAKAKDGDYAMYVQRMAFLVKPEKESVEFLSDTYKHAAANKDAIVERGAVGALGGAIHRLVQAGETDEAKSYDARLRADLSHAATPGERLALLSALGNAGLPDDRDAIRNEAHDADMTVRDQVAHSLRSFNDAESRGTLLGLASDANPTVASEAFRTLTKLSVSSDEWGTLEGLVVGAKTPQSSDSALLQLVGTQLATAGEHADAILQTLLARVPSTNGDLRANILAVMAARQAG